MRGGSSHLSYSHPPPLAANPRGFRSSVQDFGFQCPPGNNISGSGPEYHTIMSLIWHSEIKSHKLVCVFYYTCLKKDLLKFLRMMKNRLVPLNSVRDFNFQYPTKYLFKGPDSAQTNTQHQPKKKPRKPTKKVNSNDNQCTFATSIRIPLNPYKPGVLFMGHRQTE